jgi:hypothetical protein
VLVVGLICDHIEPIKKSWGRRLDATNFQLLCNDCNLAKASSDQTDWRGNAALTRLRHARDRSCRPSLFLALLCRAVRVLVLVMDTRYGDAFATFISDAGARNETRSGGSTADMARSNRDVRFTPESGHSLASIACPLYVIKGIDDSAAFQGAIITEPSHSTPLVLFNCS